MTVVRHASATCQDWPGDRRAVVVVGRPRRAPGSPPCPRRRPRGRRLHRRRRLHRPVDRLRAAAGRPVAVGRGARARGGRLRRLGPQRRLGPGRGLHGLAPACGGRRGRRSRALERAIQETVDEVGAACAPRGHRLRLRQGRLADRRADRARSSRACARRRAASVLDVDARPPRACAVAGAARRALHAALRARAAGEARARPGGGGRAPRRRRSTRARRRSTSRRAACGRPRARCARAGSCAPPRATPRRCRASSARCCRCSSSMIVTEPLRRRDVGADRLGGLRDARRRRPRLHLRAAHRRRADRHRRPRAPLPLRLGHRPRRRDPRRDGAPAARAPHAPVPGRCATCAVDARLDGRLRRPARLVPPRCLRPRQRPVLGRRLRRSTASPRPTSPRRTLRDLILGRDTELAACRGSATAPAAGSPSRCAGSAVQTVYGAFRAADAIEDRTGKPSRVAGAAGALAGR